MKNRWMVLPLLLPISAAMAQDNSGLSKEQIAAKLNGVEASHVGDSPVQGVYEVAIGSNVAYVTTDGRYLLQGELYDLQTNENLTELTRSSARVDVLADVDPDTMLVFSPEASQVKHTITIFTDVDCGYCRQFHREIDQVNALGIRVNYLSYPRTGPDTESWFKAERVWCADDRNDALTRAKAGGEMPDEAACGTNPVAMHFELGHQVGVRGTPAIYSANGDWLGGYLPPQALLERLDELSE